MTACIRSCNKATTTSDFRILTNATLLLRFHARTRRCTTTLQMLWWVDEFSCCIDTNRMGRQATVLAVDCGMKFNIIRQLLSHKVVATPDSLQLSAEPTGETDCGAMGLRLHARKVRRSLFEQRAGRSYLGATPVHAPSSSHNVKQCGKTIANIKRAVDANQTIFGICLGNQLLALAIGTACHCHVLPPTVPSRGTDCEDGVWQPWG